MTDANVFLGRLPSNALLDGGMPIDKSLAEASIKKLSEALSLTLDETALGIVDVASATMVKAIRSISIERGHNPADFALFVYGGAGALHANSVAKELDIDTIIVPLEPGILCADGAVNSNLTIDFVKTLLVPLEKQSNATFVEANEELGASCVAWFTSEGLTQSQQALTWSVDLRYVGQNYELTLPLVKNTLEGKNLSELSKRFHESHDRNYGFSSIDQDIQIVSLKVKANGILPVPPLPKLDAISNDAPQAYREVMFTLDQWDRTPVFRRDNLGSGQLIKGPAVIEQLDTTILVYPDDTAKVDEWGNLIIGLGRD